MNLIGEHTDYNDGFCMPLAIDRGCDATVSERRDAVVRISSAQQPAPVEIGYADLRPGMLGAEQKWAGYAAGVVWALREREFELPGLNVELDADLPMGAGLGSSAALACAVAAAISGLADLALEGGDLVSVARAAENEFVSVPTGGMDQLASVFGRAGMALFCDMRSLRIEALPFDIESAGLQLYVVDSKATHRLADGPYAQRRAACQEAARRLGVPALRDVGPETLDESLARLDDELLGRRVRHVVTENARTLIASQLLRNRRFAELGPLLNASHASLRDDFDVSVPQIELAVEVLLECGAAGARVTGGGFGGSAIALLRPDQAERAGDELARAFVRRGFTRPEGFTVRASAGTHRL